MNYDPTICLLLKATGLHNLATSKSMNIAWMSDGAEFTKIIGAKITDPHGMHPTTKMPLVSTDPTDGTITYVNMQSREMCCILVIADARESKSLYIDVFKEYYGIAEMLQKEGLPESKNSPALKPFDLMYPQDLSSAWKTSAQMGGRVHVKW